MVIHSLWLVLLLTEPSFPFQHSGVIETARKLKIETHE